MHPPSGSHSGVIDRLSDLHRFKMVGLESVLDSDLIYFDHDRDDVELAKAINDFCGNGCNGKRPMTCTPTAKPSLKWWSGDDDDDDNPFGPLPEIPKRDTDINLSFSRLTIS